MDVRHRDWLGFLNARTLAGVITDWGPIRAGRLYRSDEPVCDLTAVLKTVAAEGISRVLDLRSQMEIQRRPSVLGGEKVYRVVPLVDPRMDHLRDPAAENSLLDLYRGSLDRNGRTLVAAVRAIIEAPDGGVLVHCAAGKDRTGILVAVVLAAMGASRHDIISDYTETEQRLAPYFAAELAGMDDLVRRARVASRQHATPDTMAGLLDHLDHRHGGAARYLGRNGLPDHELRSLSYRLTADVP